MINLLILIVYCYYNKNNSPKIVDLGVLLHLCRIKRLNLIFKIINYIKKSILIFSLWSELL